jgi:hypothetical protein
VAESTTVNVKGLSELQAFLDQLPAKLQRNVMRGAMRAAAKAVEPLVKQGVPKGPPSSEGASKYGQREGDLATTIRVSVRIKGGQVVAKVAAGGTAKSGAPTLNEAIWNEYGTRPHAIDPVSGALKIGDRFVAHVQHPGAIPQPFMRPAFDRGVSAAILAAGNYVKNRLATKNGLDTSDISVEVDES